MGQPKPHTRPLHVGSNSSTRHVKCFACGEPCREQFRNPYTSYTRASARARVQPRRFPRRPRTPSHFLCTVNNVVRYALLSRINSENKGRVVGMFKTFGDLFCVAFFFPPQDKQVGNVYSSTISSASLSSPLVLPPSPLPSRDTP